MSNNTLVVIFLFGDCIIKLVIILPLFHLIMKIGNKNMIRKPSLSFIKPLKNLSGKEFSYYVFTALITMFLMAFYTGFMVYSKKLDRSTLITNDLVYLIASSITGILVMPVMEKIIPWYFDKPF